VIVNHLRDKEQDAATAAVPAFVDYCAPTKEGSLLRGKLVYTDIRYMSDKPIQTPENPDQHWCVTGTTYESTLFWGIVYVGQDNPLYKTMVAENGEGDNASRAVITYQGVPAVKFARDGWLGFITDSDDVSPW